IAARKTIEIKHSSGMMRTSGQSASFAHSGTTAGRGISGWPGRSAEICVSDISLALITIFSINAREGKVLDCGAFSAKLQRKDAY
ncbi:MAG TPA: hypothetical protein VJS37_06770, partial [Terriglobales bacterium]|nr:hypothetical protein [Terriglobales bacterium]